MLAPVVERQSKTVDGRKNTTPNAPGREWEREFAGDLRAAGKNERTVSAYLQDVRSFASWFETTNGEAFNPGLITGFDLRAYRGREVERIAPATWNRRRVALMVLTKWAMALKNSAWALDYDPFQGVERMGEVEQAPRWLERGEMGKLMRQVELAVNGARTEAGTVQARRNQAMICLMVYAGLREGEVCALDVEDVQISERKGKVVVRRGKGDKRREVPLNGECRAAIQNMGRGLSDKPRLTQKNAEENKQDGQDGQDKDNHAAALFIGKAGERLGERTVQRIVAELGRKAGLEVSPHDLRHTCAKRMLDGGAPLTVVQKVLGHSRLETTARYVTPGWSDLERAVGAIEQR